MYIPLSLKGSKLDLFKDDSNFILNDIKFGDKALYQIFEDNIVK